MSITRHRVALLTFIAGAILAAGTANAVTLERNFAQNATGACQAALPVYDGQIRKRPLAVQNEGTASAFVTCSFMSTTRGVGGARSMKAVSMYATNNTANALDLTCTLVDGFPGQTSVYLPQTQTLPANAASTNFLWIAADNGGLNFSNTVNTSCNLPVGVGLTIIYTYYDEDVG